MTLFKMLIYNLTMLAATAASGLLPRQDVAVTSTCPANYEPTVLTTNATAGHIFTIFSPKNPVTHNHALQLCPILLPDPALANNDLASRSPGASKSYAPSTVGCFAPSLPNATVLLTNLRSGGLYTQSIASGQIPLTVTDAGPTAYLSRFDSRGSTTRFNFTFTPDAADDSLVEKEWQLTQIDWEGQYGLYHLTETGVVHGFALCDVEGPDWMWKQMFYTRTPGFEIHEGDYPECENVGLRTRVVPLIKNGICLLAPYDGVDGE